MHRRRLLGLSPLLALAALEPPGARATPACGDSWYQRTAKRSFSNIVQDAEFAITDHNFRITARDHIGSAIAERHQERFPRAEVIFFCNLEYARRLLQTAPDFLLYMPCKIALREADGQVVIATWLLPENNAAALIPSREVNEVLRAIVDYAAGDWFAGSD